MHMNSLGKNWKCQEITKKTLDLFVSKSDNLSISLYWKVPHSTYTATQKSSNSAVYSPVMNQRSLRKKRPTIRNEDFFMGLTQSSSLKIIQNTQTSLYLFHQNIRDLKHKMDELICMLYSCDLSPHIICFSERYLTFWHRNYFFNFSTLCI